MNGAAPAQCASRLSWGLLDQVKSSFEMVKAPQPPGAPSPHASHTHCDGHGHHNLSGARIARQEAPACAFLHTTLRGRHTRTESAARFVSASPCCGTARAA